MKKYILLLVCLLPLAALAQDFKITGIISKKNFPIMAYICYDINGMYQFDSAAVKNGRFLFHGGLNGEPVIGNMGIRYKAGGLLKNDELKFYIDGSDIHINATDLIRSATVTGSTAETENRQLSAALEPYLIPYGRLNGNIMDALHANPAVVKEAWFKLKIDSIGEYLKKAALIKKQFVDKHPNSYIALLTFFNDWHDASPYNLDSIKRTFSKFSDRVRSTTTGQQIAEMITRAELRQVNAIVPDLLQPDINGKPFSTATIKGKYLLIDFWASWCAPCRAENPNVLKAYKALHDKGLEIVSISLDYNSDAWKAAVTQDGLPWLQLSDLKGFSNSAARYFGIRSIPQNILVGPNGKVVANNLRGEDMDKKIAKLMKVE